MGGVQRCVLACHHLVIDVTVSRTLVNTNVDRFKSDVTAQLANAEALKERSPTVAHMDDGHRFVPVACTELVDLDRHYSPCCVSLRAGRRSGN